MEMPMEEDDMAMDALIDGMDSDGFEEQAMNFAKGGMPTYEEYTGRSFNTPETIQHLKYVNAEGESITIPTLRGKALRPIPEGYTLYVPPEEGDIVDPPEEEEEVIKDTVNSGPSADAERANSYRNDAGQSGYQADVNRSERIRRDRADTIESLASPDMGEAEMDVMYAALTPQAKMIYDTRFRDKSTRGFLDGFMADGQSPTDLLITAQKTADSQNRLAGKVEPDSGFLPNGEPIDWAKALKYAGAGLVMGPMGLIGVAQYDMTDEELEEAKINLTAVGKVLGSIGEDSPFKDNTAQPNKPINSPYTKLNQDYWKSFTGDVGAEKRRLEGLTGLNAYGHKIYKEPGSRTVWDDIAEVEANKQNTKDLQALRATEAQDAKNLAEVRANRSIAVKKAKEAIAANELANEVALTNRENARLNFTPTPTTTPTTVNSGGGDNKSDKPDTSTVASGPPGRNYSSSTSNDDEDDGGPQDGQTMDYAHGGLAAKKKQPIMKMRKDPTSGLAAKKKSKQKAKAKKGALAAKRT
jgi:hypothetical protein